MNSIYRNLAIGLLPAGLTIAASELRNKDTNTTGAPPVAILARNALRVQPHRPPSDVRKIVFHFEILKTLISK